MEYFFYIACVYLIVGIVLCTIAAARNHKDLSKLIHDAYRDGFFGRPENPILRIALVTFLTFTAFLAAIVAWPLGLRGMF